VIDLRRRKRRFLAAEDVHLTGAFVLLALLSHLHGAVEDLQEL